MAAAGSAAADSATGNEWEPTQYQQQPQYDLRNAKHGPKGFKLRTKRKLDDYEEQVQEEKQQINMEEAELVGASIQTRKRTKHDTVGVGKVSGRPWKVPGQRAGSLKSAILSTTWEKKMKDKAAREAFVAKKREAVAARKAKLSEIKRRKEEAKERKKANQAKSAIVQKVTNPAKLKKLMKSKKARKRLVTVDGGTEG